MLAASLAAALAGCAGGDSVSSGEPRRVEEIVLLVKPVDQGRLTSTFGWRRHHLVFASKHQGLDWAAPAGTPVRAAGDGVIVSAGTRSGYGRYVRIHHGLGVETAYAHLAGFTPGVRRGAYVRRGEMIGYVGTSGNASGPHLHYEVLIAGRQVDPLALSRAYALAPAGGRG